MHRIILLALISWSFRLQAQIAFDPGVLHFGRVAVDSIRSMELFVENVGEEALALEVRTLFPAFTVEPAILNLSGGERGMIQVSFRPEQNVRYNDELLFISEDALNTYTIDLRGEGRLLNTYYDATFDLWEEELKESLRTLISANYRSLGYNTARDRMYGSIDNVNGEVTCVYTGRVARFNTRSGATQADFNCEHTWPQSMFNSSEPEKSDIHHLFPTHSFANSIRGNLPFGEVNSASWTEGGSSMGDGKFEVRPAHRGDAARALFYFATRYRNYQSFLTAQESILREWSMQDMPDAKERSRNEAIFNEQRNRNPYVDFPGFLDRISSLSTNSVRKVQVSAFAEPSSINALDHVLQQQDTFRVLVANNGNTTLHFDRVNLITNDFVLLGSSDLDLEPGDAHLFHLLPASWSVDPPVLLSDTLLIASPEQTFRIPIRMEIRSVGLDDDVDRPDRIWYSEGKLYLKGLDGFTLRLIDQKGSEQYFTEITHSLAEMALPSLPSGVYFAEAIRGKRVYRVRFLIAD
ncbi:MAG: endonuclease [Flavobacteriales bacterium]|nr:endonuclease [Flavobacteriales bacterium]